MKPHFRFFAALSLPLLALSIGWYVFFSWSAHRKRLEILAESLPPAFNRQELAALQKFRLAAASHADKQLFEGLPHSYWETDSFENERKTKPVRQQDREYFYAEPLTLTLTPLDESLIFELLSRTATFRKIIGLKACGGYHADWLLEWRTTPDQVHRLQICLGCGEANIKGIDYAIHTDISHEAKIRLEKLLTSYSKNRPARQR